MAGFGAGGGMAAERRAQCLEAVLDPLRTDLHPTEAPSLEILAARIWPVKALVE